MGRFMGRFWSSHTGPINIKRNKLIITAAEKINIGGLVKGRHLLIPITLAYNGLAIEKKDVLFNTEAGVYAFIKIEAARNFRKVTGARRIQLRRL